MIYLIRHGQTVKNKENVLQGRSNSPLNEAGKQQAQAAGEMLEAAADGSWSVPVPMDRKK